MTKKSTLIVLRYLKWCAWIIFIALCIDAGGYITGFIANLCDTDVASTFYKSLDLRNIYSKSSFAFFGIYVFVIATAILKAYLFYQAIMLTTKINLEKPYDRSIATRIKTISNITLAIGISSEIARRITKRLEHNGFETDTLHALWADSQAYILMGCVLFILASIFLVGVEYQEELEETV